MVQLKRNSPTTEPAMRQSWPSRFATSSKYPTPGDEPTPDGAEEFAIRCRNCGFPIPDYRSVSDCPSCATTNFRKGAEE